MTGGGEGTGDEGGIKGGGEGEADGGGSSGGVAGGGGVGGGEAITQLPLSTVALGAKLVASGLVQPSTLAMQCVALCTFESDS